MHTTKQYTQKIVCEASGADGSARIVAIPSSILPTACMKICAFRNKSSGASSSACRPGGGLAFAPFSLISFTGTWIFIPAAVWIPYNVAAFARLAMDANFSASSAAGGTDQLPSSTCESATAVSETLSFHVSAFKVYEDIHIDLLSSQRNSCRGPKTLPSHLTQCSISRAGCSVLE